jgi:hypothetical protein
VGVAALGARFLRVEEADPDPGLRSLGSARRYLPLLASNVFMTYHAGYAGSPSDSGREFRRIRDAANRAAVFVGLVKNGLTAGKLYGLCGLLIVDRLKFEELSAQLAASRERVILQEGCVESSSTLERLLYRPGGRLDRSRFFSICDDLGDLSSWSGI